MGGGSETKEAEEIEQGKGRGSDKFEILSENFIKAIGEAPHQQSREEKFINSSIFSTRFTFHPWFIVLTEIEAFVICRMKDGDSIVISWWCGR